MKTKIFLLSLRRSKVSPESSNRRRCLSPGTVGVGPSCFCVSVMQLPNGVTQSHSVYQDRFGRLQEHLRQLPLLFRKLRLLYERCVEMTSELQEAPAEVRSTHRSVSDVCRLSEEVLQLHISVLSFTVLCSAGPVHWRRAAFCPRGVLQRRGASGETRGSRGEFTIKLGSEPGFIKPLRIPK